MWRESPNRYRLTGKKCLNCNKIYFPSRDICPVCHRESIGKMADFDLKGFGEIYSFTVVHENPPAFSRQKPYVMALIKLDEGPMITAQVVDADLSEIAFGTRVRSVFRKISEDGQSGIIYYGYKFVCE
jgi:uncharacterized OB-fold protein